ncbi:M20/M25/M40 family metallo-hydrolase [Rhizosaccharibacter radicis]|uniref:M20/M25/M40 family metallo-hydrolase n=1 Tax=Rhizosaccharibacter radicis TaxID=2782605 RepID=A0ABT1W3B2_9PROT|nr:M20/M25/M40 family metallo-hydrolase [Acetobacteraceae bacterium KSS12]
MPAAEDRAEWWARRLGATPSVTGSAEEAAFAPFLRDLLRDAPLFRDRPDDVWLLPVPGGVHERSCVLALLRGSGPDTVVLTGHFDTVGIENYGALAPLALDPGPLADALLSSLAGGTDAAARRARDDLSPGAGGEPAPFVPGRGLLDMKAGLAAALAAMEAFAAGSERRGNLLFVAVPDEEANSAGAHAAAAALPAVAREKGLRLRAAINLDAIADDGDGRAGRAVTLGTVGKLCPSVLVIGRPVHACYGYDGVSATALAGAIAAAMEWHPGLAERDAEARDAEEQGAGPTLLGSRDDRTRYDVTMPGTAWLYWNVITHRRGAGEVLDTVAETARRAAASLRGTLRERRALSTGIDRPLPPLRVLRFSALMAELREKRPDAVAILSDRAAALAATALDLPEQCRLLSLLAAELLDLQGPAVVVGLASVPYLPTMLEAPALEAAVRRATGAVAARHGTGIAVRRRFPAICDMSAFGQADPAELPVLAAETPAWHGGVPALAVAGLPCINAGPWGRDYHTRLERMHREYGFRVLPDLVLELSRALLDAGT